MITKENTYKKAFEIKKNNLNQKEQRYNVMVNAAYASNPRLNEIDFKLSGIGASLAITAMSGDTKGVEALKKQSEQLSLEKQLLLNKVGVEKIVYDCPLCDDTGYVNGKICDCVKALASKIMMEDMNDEMPLDDCRFDNFDLKYYSDKTDKEGGNPRRRMTAVLKVCKEYVINFTPKNCENLLFMGQAGLGKTHLSLAIVSGLVEKGFTPIYASAENLFMQIEKEKFLGENRGAYEAMVKCDLLVIDDLGAEMSTSFTVSALYNLINTRLLSGRPTIINTNLTMKEIEKRYTARISSRLIGSFSAFKFLGDDIRQQKALKR